MKTFEMADILPGLIAQPVVHARFLYGLAHLEYVGSRKIAKALPASHMDAPHLEHLQEEAGHAFFLRREAEKLDNSRPEPRFLKAIEGYLQTVDHGISETIRKSVSNDQSFAAYLVVSLVIEERAMDFYPLYHRLLPEGSIKNAVHAIMKDEVGHLQDMQAAFKERFGSNLDLLDACRSIEHQAYADIFLPLTRNLLA